MVGLDPAVRTHRTAETEPFLLPVVHDLPRTEVGEEEATLPPVDNLSINRQELLSQGQQIPPALALFFSMAQGTTKRLEAPGNIGWFVVDLNRIATDEVQANDPIVAAARQQLGAAISDELAEQMTTAIRAELGVETNEAAIAAVSRQLTGEGR